MFTVSTGVYTSIIWLTSHSSSCRRSNGSLTTKNRTRSWNECFVPSKAMPQNKRQLVVKNACTTPATWTITNSSNGHGSHQGVPLDGSLPNIHPLSRLGIMIYWGGPFLCACFFLRFEVQKRVPSLSYCFAPISIALRLRGLP